MSSRRNFIKDFTGGTAAVCCIPAALLMDACTPVNRIRATVVNGKIEVDKTMFVESKYVVINTDRLKRPVYLNQVNSNSYRAFLMDCTHKKCELRPTGTFMTCPCHGSEFSNSGQVLNGPATDPLYEFSVQVKDIKIEIDLTQIVQHGKEN
ncbi:MAG: Rieske 2Fe-2S domain-containing protein [Flavobacteriales bacterium]|nr:Rieske 2Fe-2S domain-containing protein [Flavobacteriales bacterium]